MTLLNQLGLIDNPRVLVLSPHPGAEILGCGGLIALLVRGGASIQVEIVTDGGFSQQDGDFPKLIEESRAAAAIIGYSDPCYWGWPGRSLRLNRVLIDQITLRLDRFQPHLLLIPSPWETHPDQLAVASAAIEVVRTSGPAAPQVLFYELEVPLQANKLIDISAVAERKSQAVACFRTESAARQQARSIIGLNTYRAYGGGEGTFAEAFHSPEPSLLKYGGVNIQTLVPRTQIQNESPVVDILVRTTGRPELSQALHSVIGQTYPNVRLILLDIGSKLPFSLDPIAARIPVRLLSDSGKVGRADAANRLLDASDAPYALFLDDDDWLLPEHIENLISALEGNPDAVAAYGDTACLEQRNGDWVEIRRFSGPVEIQRLVFENRLPIHAVLFCRERLAHLRFDEAFDLFEDWDWWLQVSTHGRMLHVPKTGAIYRIHSAGGLGVRADEKQASAALDQIIQKWHVGARPEIIKERLAYVRQLMVALDAEQHNATKLRESIDESNRALLRMQQKHAAEVQTLHETLNLRDRQIATHLDHIQELRPSLKGEGNAQPATDPVGVGNDRLSQLEQQLAHLHDELDHRRKELARIYASNSWRLTRFARGGAREVRRRLGVEPGRPKMARSTSSLRHRILQRMRGSRLVRWIYYRLPLSESQRFKLRTWGRSRTVIANVEASTVANSDTAENVDYLALHLPARLNDIAVSRLPLISIIIPCYNQGQFLSDSIASAYSAYSGALDILVVNDGSTDSRTLRSLREIAMLYPEVRVLHQENGGLSAARNTGIAQARGEYIQFLDADDQLVPGKLDAQIRHIVSDNVDVSICNYLIADASLGNLAKSDETIANHASYGLQEILFNWERSLSIPIHCGLFSRQVFAQIQFNTTLHAKEDWVFWCSLAQAGFIPAYTDFHGAIYRMHEGSMRRSFVRMARQWMQAVAYLDPLVSEDYPTFFEESVRWVNKYYRSNPIYKDEIARMSKEK